MLLNNDKSQFELPKRKVSGPCLEEGLHPVDLTEEELAIILDEEVGREPTLEELCALVPGYEKRILAGVLARIERRG